MKRSHCVSCGKPLKNSDRWDIHPTLAEKAKKTVGGKHCGPCANESNRLVGTPEGPQIIGCRRSIPFGVIGKPR